MALADITVDGEVYTRIPIKTHLITEKDTMSELVRRYAVPLLALGDLIFISEKIVCVVQGRIIPIKDVKTTPLARFLAKRVKTNLHTPQFRGFGHGTAMAMQLFIEEAGVPRVLFAAAVAAVTRPLGIKGLFYLISGKQAKSVDCPMSYTLHPYNNYAKRAPKDTDGVAHALKKEFGYDVVIVDANYQGVFSLGKSNRAISEKFIQAVYRDNPVGQSDEMTPLCIVRKKSV